MLNQCIFEGYLTKDPETFKTASGVTICNITIAVDRAIKREGKSALFLVCRFYGKQAENLARYFHKGRAILVSGRMENDTYQDKNGNQKTIMYLESERFDFPIADRKKEGQQGNGQPQPNFMESALEGGESEKKSGNLSDLDFADEDTPF